MLMATMKQKYPGRRKTSRHLHCFEKRDGSLGRQSEAKDGAMGGARLPHRVRYLHTIATGASGQKCQLSPLDGGS